MSRFDLDAVAAQCTTQEGALALVYEIEKRLTRPPSALYRLAEAIAQWSRPIPIDDAVRDLVEAVDPIVEMRGYSVRTLLEAMRVATRQRAEALRQKKATTGRRKVKP